jgi:hypothetical protein
MLKVVTVIYSILLFDGKCEEHYYSIQRDEYVNIITEISEEKAIDYMKNGAVVDTQEVYSKIVFKNK